MVMEMRINEGHKIPKQETQKLNNSNISPPFVMHQKGKRHQHKRDINLKNTCIKDLKIFETISKLMNP